MAIEKAITLITVYKSSLTNACSNQLDVDIEAFNMAIKALSALEDIKKEMEQELVGYPPSSDYYKAIMKCLQIIDKHIK